MRAKCLARSRKRAAAGHLPLIRPAATFPQGGRLQSGQLRHTRPSSGPSGRLPAKGKAFAYDKKGVTQLNTEKVISRDNDYILHTYGRSQVVLAEGEGMTARDADGKS